MSHINEDVKLIKKKKFIQVSFYYIKKTFLKVSETVIQETVPAFKIKLLFHKIDESGKPLITRRNLKIKFSAAVKNFKAIL